MATHTLDLTEHLHGDYDWQVIGVVPTQDDVDRDGIEMATHSSTAFAYTVSDDPYALWCPTASIEGRYAGPHLVSLVLNVLLPALRDGDIAPGDDVVIPFGVVVDNELQDMNCAFWIGQEIVSDPDGIRFQCHMSPTDFVLPVLWSSGLGWPEDESG